MYRTYGIGGLAGLGAVLFVLLLSPTVGAVPLSAFIPFGPSAGEGTTNTRLPACDDTCSISITLRQPFHFFRVSQSTLFVNNNGNLTSGASFPDFTPSVF